MTSIATPPIGRLTNSVQRQLRYSVSSPPEIGPIDGTDSGVRVLHQFPAEADRIVAVLRDAFVSGFNAAFRVDAALAFVGVAVAALYVGGRVQRRRIAPSEAKRAPARPKSSRDS